MHKGWAYELGLATGKAIRIAVPILLSIGIVALNYLKIGPYEENHNLP